MVRIRPRSVGSRVRGLVLCMWFLAGPAAAQQDPAHNWFATLVSQGDIPFQVTHFWSRGPRLRMELVVGDHRVVQIVNGETYFVLDAVLGRGVAIRRHPRALAADRPDRRPFGDELERLLEAGAEKIREERVAGKLADVYRLTEPGMRRTLWVSHDPPRLPIKLEVYNRSRGLTATHSYLSWTHPPALPDLFFEPDPRFEIEAVSYEAYVERSASEPVGPAPVLLPVLLHGPREGPGGAARKPR